MMFKRAMPWLLLFLGGGVLLWGLVPIAGHLLGEKLGAGVVAEIKLATDINPWLEKLLLTVLGVAATAVFVTFNLSLSWKKQFLGTVFISAIWAFTYAGLAQYTSDPIDGPWFTTEGDPLRCYVLDRTGLRLLYTVKRDPHSGQVCETVTQTLEPRLRAWLTEQRRAGGKLELRAVVAPQIFFHVGGAPLFWYYQWPDGRCEFFAVPGVHPQQGVPLIEISSERLAGCKASDRIARQMSEEKDRREATAVAQLAQEARRRNYLAAKHNAAREHQAAYVGSLMVPGSVVLATARLGELASTALEITRELGQAVVLKSGFVGDGLFESVWNGGDELRHLGLERARFVLLVKPSANTISRHSPELQGLIFVRQDYAVLIHKPPFVATPQAVQFTAEGRAFSEPEARERLRADFAEKLRNSLDGKV